jgi:predicted double-glycine peptidase
MRTLLAILAGFLLMPSNASGQEAETARYEGFYAGANLQVPIRTLRQRKYAGIVRQQYDFSCGSAALASLLTYHYDIPRTESDVFLAMWQAGEKELIRARGFSLLDMKLYLNRHGVLADGFNVPFEKLNELALPGIALVNINGYSHFVVVKGVRGEEVLIGDPSVGLVVRSKEEFLNSWDGTMLFLKGFVPWGRASWNRPVEWSAFPLGRPEDRIEDRNLAVDAIHQFRAFNSGFGVGSGL